ncbi:Rpn family recombination-promoting nuclease/putative transposase [Candidatus Trichorickettsia mobilis]|uniref:Rpn family recombination-promoting nuclease/putative transposase n=1 Tax=Candidatus Trichorickettsia mobilis TaxID=1346319 RepID=UPI00292E6ED1|nr:Rpn family recombination-promoting nuclease/putative transposase [Candidatus Trichorickettsia mobilis]
MNRISPRVDVAFKKIFGVEENKDLLISLINSIVSNEDQVVDLTLLNPYNPQNFYRDKLSVLDIKAKGIDGKRFNIEIQISDEADYDKRALYYWAKLYTEQLRVAEDYSLLSKAIGIHILNFVSIPDAAKYHNVFHITEKDSGLLYFKDLELHTIELKKFTDNSNEELSDIIVKVKNSLDVWLAFLTRNDLLRTDNLPKILDNPELKKAINVLEVMNFTDAEREAYEEHLKWLRIEANSLKKYGEKARAEGRAEEKIVIAKNLLKSGLTNDLIAASTGLTIEEINKLKD